MLILIGAVAVAADPSAALGYVLAPLGVLLVATCAAGTGRRPPLGPRTSLRHRREARVRMGSGSEPPSGVENSMHVRGDTAIAGSAMLALGALGTLAVVVAPAAVWGYLIVACTVVGEAIVYRDCSRGTTAWTHHPDHDPRRKRR